MVKRYLWGAAAISLLIDSTAKAQVLLNPMAIALPSDYPTSAIRAGEQGDVTFRVTLDRRANPTACKIISSSGSKDLDATTCRLVMERAKFELTAEQKKARAGGQYTSYVRWLLPVQAATIPVQSETAQELRTTYKGGRPCAAPSLCYGSSDAERLDRAYSATVTTSDQRKMMESLILKNTTDRGTNWKNAAQTYFSWRETTIAQRSKQPQPAIAENQSSRPYASLTKNTLCQQMKKARKAGAPSYSEYLLELSYRGLTEQKCAVQWGKILLGVAAVGAIAAVAASSNGGGGGQGSSFYGSDVDVTFSWDEQPNGYGGRQWVCRGEETGRYAELWRCAGKAKIDYRWPG